MKHFIIKATYLAPLEKIKEASNQRIPAREAAVLDRGLVRRQSRSVIKELNGGDANEKF